MKKKIRNAIIKYDINDSITDKILSIRGIIANMRHDFISPGKEYLHDPFELENMHIASERIIKAIRNDETITIYGDPDADGITSTAIAYGYLKLYTDNINYILNQREEGHGVIVDKINSDTDLLIIVDSSTNSVDECKAIDCDIIMFDHHEKEVDNPHAIIVNPQLCDYENKALSGATVCYQFCRAFDSINDVNFADNFADLATVGCIGDMMDLSIMENRAIVNLGLNKVHKKEGNFGLYMLFKSLGKEFLPTSQDIGYYIAPCLNAIIRLDDIYILMDLFKSEDKKECSKIIKKIIKVNNDRKILTEKIANNLKAREMIDDNNKILVVDVTDLNFKNGLTGLIANKISREYQKPCFMLKRYGKELRGSGRGFGFEINLKDELNDSGLFTLAQGHQNAFGVGFNADKKDEIIKYFNDKFKNYFNDQFYEYDLEFSYDDMDKKTLEEIDSISIICGEGFPRPSFLIQNLELNMWDKIGKEKNHTKLTVKDDIDLNIMKFNTREDLDDYENSDYINVIGNIGINKYFNYKLKKQVITKQILSEVIECETIDL